MMTPTTQRKQNELLQSQLGRMTQQKKQNRRNQKRSTTNEMYNPRVADDKDAQRIQNTHQENCVADDEDAENAIRPAPQTHQTENQTQKTTATRIHTKRIGMEWQRRKKRRKKGGKKDWHALCW